MEYQTFQSDCDHAHCYESLGQYLTVQYFFFLELESFIDNYLRKVNREVEEYNSRISQQAFHDLFEE